MSQPTTPEADKSHQGYAQGFGFLAGLAGGGPFTPNEPAIHDFLATAITQGGAPASSVLASMTNSANIFLNDPAGINDAVQQASPLLKP